MTVRAALWDMDGVLVDTSAFHFEAFRELLASMGRKLAEEDFRRVFGLRNDAILRELLGELPPSRVDDLARQKEETFRAKAAGNVRPLPGALALIEKLQKGGKRLAIVSSAPRANVDMVLESLNATEAFDVVISEGDAPRGKPDPQGYLLAAERLGVSPAECVVLEDAPGGVQAAKQAGMRCIGVARGRRHEELKAADLVVSTLEDESVDAFLDISS